MVDISVAKDSIVIKLDTKEKFLAFKRMIVIPKKNIASVSTEIVKSPWLAPKVGTHVPKKFMAGTFWIGKGKSFYYVRDFSKCITIRLVGHDYSNVIVETEDKIETAKRLEKALG